MVNEYFLTKGWTLKHLAEIFESNGEENYYLSEPLYKELCFRASAKMENNLILDEAVYGDLYFMKLQTTPVFNKLFDEFCYRVEFVNIQGKVEVKYKEDYEIQSVILRKFS